MREVFTAVMHDAELSKNNAIDIRYDHDDLTTSRALLYVIELVMQAVRMRSAIRDRFSSPIIFRVSHPMLRQHENCHTLCVPRNIIGRRTCNKSVCNICDGYRILRCLRKNNECFFIMEQPGRTDCICHVRLAPSVYMVFSVT